MEGVGAWRCAFGTVLNGVDFAYAACKLPRLQAVTGVGIPGSKSEVWGG